MSVSTLCDPAILSGLTPELQGAINDCYCKDPSVAKCAAALPNLKPADVETVWFFSPLQTIDPLTFNNDLVSGLTDPSNAKTAGDVKKFWNNALAPGLTDFCNKVHKTGCPSLEAMQAAPDVFVKNLIDSQLTPPEKFLYKYGLVFFVVVLAVLLALAVSFFIYRNNVNYKLRSVGLRK